MPAEPHRIRLRGFWKRLPGDGAAYERAFGRPRAQGAPEELWLVGGPFAAEAELSVNGTKLATVPAGEPLAARLPPDLPARSVARVAFAADVAWGEELVLEIRPSGEPPA